MGYLRTCLAAALLSFTARAPAAAPAEMVDTTLVLAVDVSGSIDDRRYRLQMEGIARTFEDPAVRAAILAGKRHAILVTLVEWSTKPSVSVPWTLIASDEDAQDFADRVRAASRVATQFTCLAAALRFVSDKVLPLAPMRAERTVVDVSGDGHDNCNPQDGVDRVRTDLVADGVTINGLPILEGEEADTLEAYYAQHVIGGRAAFVLPAFGFEDFERAMRHKFIIEISERRL